MRYRFRLADNHVAGVIVVDVDRASVLFPSDRLR